MVYVKVLELKEQKSIMTCDTDSYIDNAKEIVPKIFQTFNALGNGVRSSKIGVTTLPAAIAISYSFLTSADAAECRHQNTMIKLEAKIASSILSRHLRPGRIPSTS